MKKAKLWIVKFNDNNSCVVNAYTPKKAVDLAVEYSKRQWLDGGKQKDIITVEFLGEED